ncbi:MAG: hypothetical protein IJY39_00695 [Clostridia bacterium]|nr:hypothetical protein [Clostridia bacterium]
MKVILCCFAARRYWTDTDELNGAFEHVRTELSKLCSEAYLVDDSFDLNALDGHKADLMITIPMSGAVQPRILEAARHFGHILLLAGYIKDSFGEVSQRMLILNAAPAVMDVYAVLKRQHDSVDLCVSREELEKRTRALGAIESLRGCRLLAIGKTEPWVISAVKDWDVVRKKLGIEIVDVEQSELVDLYNSLQNDKCYAEQWTENAAGLAEPTPSDVSNASRMQAALIKLIEKYNARGAAIACFQLLKTGTTACLGVSYINTYTDYVVSCEGDMDSAITMLIMKQLAQDNVWMANPNIQSDGTVNFVHCTAPTVINGEKCEYILRNHHESGIGVSTQVELPKNLEMTACRISNDLSQITIRKCVGICGDYEPSCRTQLKVRFDDFDRYIKTALGCHQIFVFSDVTQELAYVANALGLEIL